MNIEEVFLPVLFIALIYSTAVQGRYKAEGTNSPSSIDTRAAPETKSKDKTDYSFVCSLNYISKSKFLCGGVLVASNYVATAAHCVDSINLNKKKEKLQVICDDGSFTSNVIDIKLHEEWLKIPRLPNDIALLRLDLSANFNVANYTTMNGSLADAELISFEFVKKKGKYTSNEGAQTVYIDHETCNGKDHWTRSIEDTMICILPTGRNDCSDVDVVSLFRLPFVQDNASQPLLLAGLSSFGTKECDKHNFSVVYTAITKYADWLNLQIFGASEVPVTNTPAELTGEQFIRNITDIYGHLKPAELANEAVKVIAADDVETLEVFLDIGLNPGSTSGELKRTLLHAAADSNAYKVAKFLIELGANSSAVSATGSTPVHAAAVSGSIAVADALLKDGAYVNALDKNYSSPLHYLIQNNTGTLSMLLYLLEAGANVHQEDILDRFPLHLAAQFNWISAAKVLLREGANIVEYAFDSGTPIHWAAAYGSDDVLEVLIDAGADLETRPFTGLLETPISYAIRNGAPLSSVKMLLNNGASPDVKDSNGFTPLHRAAVRAATDIIAVLVKAGANTGTVNKAKQYPLDIFCKKVDCSASKYRRTNRLLQYK